jgi:hypothetical protein
MPPDVRAMYDRLMVDRDGDGTPDILAQHKGAQRVVEHTQTFVVDGKTYDRIEDIPREARAAVEAVRGMSAAGPSSGAPSRLVWFCLGASVGAALVVLGVLLLGS